jgi:hypothetical protein
MTFFCNLDVRFEYVYKKKHTVQANFMPKNTGKWANGIADILLTAHTFPNADREEETFSSYLKEGPTGAFSHHISDIFISWAKKTKSVGRSCQRIGIKGTVSPD